MDVLIIGAGTMGSGIAQTLVVAGHRAYLTDPDGTALGRAQERIRTNLVREQERGRLVEPVDSLMTRLDTTRELLANPVDWVIEAAPEQASLKQKIFHDLDRHYPPSVWLASNTSSIAISHLASQANRYPNRLGGLHFFNPVPRMALVEVVPGLDTSADFVTAAHQLIESLGKTGITVPDRPGFLVNRVARPYYLEALRMVDEGVASLESVDRVMQGAGFPMGPFRVIDLVGVDVNYAVTQSVYTETHGDERYRPHPWQEQLVLRGYLGKKSGRGFYQYD